MCACDYSLRKKPRKVKKVKIMGKIYDLASRCSSHVRAQTGLNSNIVLPQPNKCAHTYIYTSINNAANLCMERDEKIASTRKFPWIELVEINISYNGD